jgi:hypothetical protein
MRNVAGLAFLASAWCGPALADTADLETGYRQAIERVQKHSKDFWLDGKPQGERALSHAWTLLADWTAAYLNEHPKATPKLLEHASPDANLDVVPLGPRTMLVSAWAGDAFGTIFIVDGTDGPFRPKWSIRGRAAREAFPLLDAWTAKGAQQDCRDAVGDADWPRCGSLAGTVVRLPDDAQGHPRFYVEGRYIALGGNTEAKQMSFWTWTGTNAEPQLATTFDVNLEDDPTRLDGDVLKVRIGENYRVISPWWDHLDRQLDWEFRIGQERIEDLGKKPVAPEPEVEAVDEVLFRVTHHLPADDVATREVQAAAGKIVDDARRDYPGGEPSLRMAGSPTVRHQGGISLVCLPTDEDAGNVTVTLAGAFVSDVSATPNDTGDFCPPDKP